MDKEQIERLRALPSVDEVLNDRAIVALTNRLPHEVLVRIVRESVSAMRQNIRAGKQKKSDSRPVRDLVVADCLTRTDQLLSPSLKRVINASGVIVHTNLGRSALAGEAIDAVVEAARGYSTLEYDIDAMARGSRAIHYEQLLCQITGAEAAFAVNNNAAAVLLILSEFAKGKDAIVSRGELIEIGGSFRIPDIMALSDAAMIEVGTTNKTKISDYQKALTPQTAVLLKVHPSNYRVVGFTEAVEAPELCKLAQSVTASRLKEDPNADPLYVFEDLGSGCLRRLSGAAGEEPTVTESLDAGCDLVTFSGDKILGGPQAGIIVGKRALIERLKKHPLARVLRLDKMTLAALEATLRLYLSEDGVKAIPTLNMLTIDEWAVQKRAAHLESLLATRIAPQDATISVVPTQSCTGGGALPLVSIPSFGLSVEFHRGNAQDCDSFLIQERDVPVIGLIRQEHLVFDLRTLVDESELAEIADALAAYFCSLQKEESL